MLYSPQKTGLVSGQKSFTSNPSVRRYSKPIIFKTRASEDLIFKNLAASFRLRPSLNITNFSLFPSNKSKKLTGKFAQGKRERKGMSEDYLVTSYTPVLKCQKKKLQVSVKSSIKPMFAQHKVQKLALEIEGRPCSRAKKYDYIDSYTSDHNEKLNA